MAKPYDISDLTKFTVADFHRFDVRVTADEWGRHGKGHEVVIFDTATRQDVSEPLPDLDADALVRHLHVTYPDTICKRHRPYERGKQPSWSLLADCTCTLVFETRLRAAINTAKLNQIDITMIKIRLAQEALSRETVRAAR